MTIPASLGPDHREVIAALGVYHLMTVEQLQRVGVADGSKRRIAAAVLLLWRKHLVGRKAAETIAYKDKLPAVHWLTPKGAAEIHVRGSERGFRGVEHTRHRLGIVDVHIALREWAHGAGVEVEDFVSDFQPNEQRGGKATTMFHASHKFSPDAVARVVLPDGEIAVFALELERGGRIEDRQPFRDGLAHWRAVAEDEVVENRLGLDHPARFVMVFQSADMRRKALGDWAATSDPVWHRFFCKGLDELGPDFNGGWWQPDGAQRALFHKIPA